MTVMVEMIPFVAPWIIIGLGLSFMLIDIGNEGEPSGPITRIARGYGDVIYNLKKFVSGVFIMLANTIKGIKKDLSNTKDKLAIRLINFLDKIRGDYDYGQEKR